MTEEMWKSLDGIEDAITLLLSVRDVINLNTLSNEEIVKLLDAIIEMFSEQQKIIWDQYKAEQKAIKSDDNTSILGEAHRKLHKEYAELERKYTDYVLWDDRNQQIENLTKENKELTQKIEELQKENYELRSSAWNKVFGDDIFNQQIKELTIQMEYYKDMARRLQTKYNDLSPMPLVDENQE